MTAHFLQELARQVRGETLRMLAQARDEWLTRAPEGTSNHILWHAGHALWVQDVLFVEPLTGISELPPAWDEKFGADCRPVKLTRDWPSRSEVLQLLTEQQARLFALIAGLTAEQLVSDAPAISRDSLLAAAIHGWHDEAKHQGEMHLLMKLFRG
jgi:hypothetical protein